MVQWRCCVDIQFHPVDQKLNQLLTAQGSRHMQPCLHWQLLAVRTIRRWFQTFTETLANSVEKDLQSFILGVFNDCWVLFKEASTWAIACYCCQEIMYKYISSSYYVHVLLGWLSCLFTACYVTCTHKLLCQSVSLSVFIHHSLSHIKGELKTVASSYRYTSILGPTHRYLISILCYFKHKHNFLFKSCE